MSRDALIARTSKHPWRADDPDRVGTTWTVADDDGHLICCINDGCGAPIEVLWEDIPALRRGHRIPYCAECLDDRQTLRVLHPPAELVRERHIAGDERRRQHAEQLRRVS